MSFLIVAVMDSLLRGILIAFLDMYPTTNSNRFVPDAEQVDHDAGQRQLVALVTRAVQGIEVALDPRHHHQRPRACVVTRASFLI
mgnify:CR=1 FL=1